MLKNRRQIPAILLDVIHCEKQNTVIEEREGGRERERGRRERQRHKDRERRSE